MNYKFPVPGSIWRRKSDGRLDKVAGTDGSLWVTMFSPDTNRHWHIQVKNFWRKYEGAL